MVPLVLCTSDFDCAQVLVLLPLRTEASVPIPMRTEASIAERTHTLFGVVAITIDVIVGVEIAAMAATVGVVEIAVENEAPGDHNEASVLRGNKTGTSARSRNHSGEARVAPVVTS